MSKFCVVLLLGVFLLNSMCFVHANDEKNTDEALLEDLGAELLKPPTSKSINKPAAPRDQRLLDQLGEDLGEPQTAEDDWLSKVVRHMQTAQSLLEQTENSVSASSAQTEALTGLDAMIAELAERQSQCKGGQCSGGKCDKPPGKKPSKPGKAGKNPAKSASSSTHSGADLSTDLAVAGELVKDLWGKLPERQREQILQPLSEEFLPKYASEIEAYFRALADPNRNATQSP